jgi:hypothetical protein
MLYSDHGEDVDASLLNCNIVELLIDSHCFGETYYLRL